MMTTRGNPVRLRRIALIFFISLAIVLFVGFLIGRSDEPAAAAKKEPTWHDMVRPEDPMADAIRDHKVKIGMTREQVTAAWGLPERNNRTIWHGQIAEQWVYGDTYLYIDNGILRSFQDSK